MVSVQEIEAARRRLPPEVVRTAPASLPGAGRDRRRSS